MSLDDPGPPQVTTLMPGPPSPTGLAGEGSTTPRAIAFDISNSERRASTTSVHHRVARDDEDLFREGILRQSSAASRTTPRRRSFSTSSGYFGSVAPSSRAHTSSSGSEATSEDAHDDQRLDHDRLTKGHTASPRRAKKRRKSFITSTTSPATTVIGATSPSRSATMTADGSSVKPSRSHLAPASSTNGPAKTRRLSDARTAVSYAAWDIEEESSGRAALSKGKGKMPERSARQYELPTSNDPLDPLSSFQAQRLPPSASSHSIRARTSGESSRHTENQSSPLRSANISASSRPYGSGAMSIGSSDSFASTSQSHLSSSVPSQRADTTSAAAISEPAQPSLQQLLQSVDLTAALRLVQTMQTQQTQQQQLAMQANSAVIAQPPPSAYPASAPAATNAPPPRINTGAVAVEGAASSPSPKPIDAEKCPVSDSLFADTPPSPSAPSDKGKAGRRRALSLGIGNAVGIGSKRIRTASAASSASALGAVHEKVPDERAAMGAYARSFEEQISRVHLSLSPATVRRAHNCARYLTLRYKPVYAALEHGQPVPNLVRVGRWREERDEAERRHKRVKGNVTAGRLSKNSGPGSVSREDVNSPTILDGDGRRSDVGSVNSGGGGVTREILSSYGARRNKSPKLWEVDPDDISEYIASGGKIRSPGEGEDLGGRQLATGFSVGAITQASTDRDAMSIGTDLPLSSLRSTSPIQSEQQRQMYGARPVASRTSSFGSSVPSRTAEHRGRHTNSVDLGKSPAPSLRRASSLVNSHRSGQTSVHDGTEATHASSPPAGSRYRHGAATAPSSPRAHMNGRDYLSGAPTSPLANGHKQLPSVGVKSNISRRFDRIRGKTMNVGTDSDASDMYDAAQRRKNGGAGYSDRSDVDMAGSPRSEDMKLRSPPRRPLLHQLSDQGASPLTRPDLRKSPTSVDIHSARGDTDGYRSSGGEEGGIGRRRPGRGLLAAAWQGFKGTLDANPAFDERSAMIAGLGGHYHREHSLKTRDVNHAPRRRRRMALESDDEEEKPVRDILDVGDDVYAQLNGSLRDVRSELTRLDKYIVAIPPVLVGMLQDLELHGISTRQSLGIDVKYPTPRLHGSVLADLASVRRGVNGAAAPSLIETQSSETSTSSGSETDTESSSGSSASERVVSSMRRRPPARARQSSIAVGAIRSHARHVTEHLEPKQTVGRPRSYTTATPFSAASSRQSPLAPPRLDSLVGLERLTNELKKAEERLEADAAAVAEKQSGIDHDINALVAAVDDAQRDIDNTQYQQLRMLEDRFFRLQTSLTRPSPLMDSLWAILAGALTCIFWLSWLVITFFRVIRTILRFIITFPWTVLRWLLFIR